MEVHIKLSSWVSLDFPQEKEELIKDLIKVKKLEDIMLLTDAQPNLIPNTLSYISPEDNGGLPTIEIMEFDSEARTIVPTWGNVIRVE